MNELIKNALSNEFKYDNKVAVDILDNTNFNIALLNSKLNNIAELKDSELKDIILNNYDYLLQNASSNELYRRSILNKKFIYVLTNLLVTRTLTLSKTSIYLYNRYIYEYINDYTATNDVKYSLQSFAAIINKPLIEDLKSIGIPETSALLLSIARYSSGMEDKCIERVNMIIRTDLPEVMTLQNIVWIYEKLFDHISIVFRTIMFSNYFIHSINPTIETNIYNAILTIINNMPTELICRIIMEYMNQLVSDRINYKIYPAFQLTRLNNNYPRVANAVNILIQQGNYVY